MTATYSFFIRNYGQFFFRIGDREIFFSGNTELKAASFSSESGQVLLLFATCKSHELRNEVVEELILI